MRRGKWLLASLAAALLLTSCGDKRKEVFTEAGQDLENGRYEEALAGYQESVSDGYQLAEAYRGMGVACLKLGRCEEAAEDLLLAKAELEGSVNKTLLKDVCLYLSVAREQSGDGAGALAECQEALGYGEDAQCYLLLGKLNLDQDRYEEAAGAFRSAVDAQDDYDMYIQVYQYYDQKDMEADGEAYLQEALQKKGESEEDYYQRGRIYYYMGDTENARLQLTEASNNGYGEAMLLLGKVFLSDNDPANARVIYQQYMDQEDRKARGYNGLALCDMAEGNYDSALEQIRLGLEAAETEEVQELLFNEAVAYEKKLDFQTAREKMEEYCRLYPDDQAAGKEYEFLLYR